MNDVLLAKAAGGRQGPTAAPESGTDVVAGMGRFLACAACLNAIADLTSLFSPDGGPLYRVFANPAGRVFEIVCARETRGTRALGVPTSEHTWFPGYAWTMLLCGNCGVHLGWSFEATMGEGRFAGLITASVVERDAPQ